MAFPSYPPPGRSDPGPGYGPPPPLQDPYTSGYGLTGYPPAGTAHAGAPPPGYASKDPPLTVTANASVLSGDSTRYCWYRVSYLGGIDLRSAPNYEAARVGILLGQNATFASSEEVLGTDGRIFLRLADGRGWAFDDSAVYPNDPAVVRGFWSPIGPANMTPQDLSGGHPPGSSHGPAGPLGTTPAPGEGPDSLRRPTGFDRAPGPALY
mmetsp:Transcript_45836/g.85559  ORF Transcript_45836/g.85559 Transcript_45836/m.85559 type:complete len:209 (+) Transcript_45836:62-688(+)